jgi:hypothetical protein
MPFVKGHQARLADDNCPHCRSAKGKADQFVPPDGYWPTVNLMYTLLLGGASDISLIRAHYAGLDIQPGRIGYGPATTRAQRLIWRACRAWNVEHSHELAAVLGVNWIWSNETERSANYREWPPMVKLALIAINDDYGFGLDATNDESFRFINAA